MSSLLIYYISLCSASVTHGDPNPPGDRRCQRGNLMPGSENKRPCQKGATPSTEPQPIKATAQPKAQALGIREGEPRCQLKSPADMMDHMKCGGFDRAEVRGGNAALTATAVAYRTLGGHKPDCLMGPAELNWANYMPRTNARARRLR
ncbi:hypothetical protein MHYP_G00014100 [Metynnis hypsauchen]